MKDFDYGESTCKDHGDYALKRPCRCGGTRFKEPRMKRTNCLPANCGAGVCSGCRCCCGCRSTCCDSHPCGCCA